MKIIIPRKALNVFRSLCRENYPNETMAVLRGKRTESGVEITAIQDFPHRGTPGAAHYSDKQIPKSKMKALRAGDDWLGTIHSHCISEEHDVCEHPSKSDIKSALEGGETVMAIVYVFEEGSRTLVNWFVPKPIPEVEYI